MQIERRLASLGVRRPWASPWGLVVLLDRDFDDVGGIEIDAAEQVRLHGCVRSSTVALEAADHDRSHWRPVVYRGRLSKQPVVRDELYIPADVKPPPEPMWRESEPSLKAEVIALVHAVTEPVEREPWVTPTLTDATPKGDVRLRELAAMSEVEFKAWLWASGHQLAHAEYVTRGKR